MLSPLVLAIIAILLIVLFVWLLLRWATVTETSTTTKTDAATGVPLSHTRIEHSPQEPTGVETARIPDDLVIIEGIGPKIALVLEQAGVTTFAQLAAMQPTQITELLHNANLHLADPTSWPEQARLAANGDMAGLEALQKTLKAGRTT